jgi:drug/metabolite transporter (DMT)-like permease
MHTRTRKLSLTEGVAAGVLFGSAAIFIRYLQNVDAFSIAFWRLLIASLTLAALLVLLKRSFSLNLVRKNLKDLVVLSFFLALHFIFFVSAVKDTTILNATVLVNTTPLFSVFVSSFLFGLRPSRMAILGLAVSFIGVCTIAYAETSVTNLNPSQIIGCPSIKGDVEAVLAALVESFYLGYGRRIRREMNILSIMFPMYLLTAIVVGVISIPIGHTITAPSTGSDIVLPLVGLGILPTAIAHTLYFSSLSNLKSFETATMALLEPIGATILGISLFQEVPAPIFAFGAALILVGILFIVKNRS